MDAKKVRTAIRDLLKQEDVPDAVADDVAFHLTDWAEDLERFYAFAADPDSVPTGEAYAQLMQFVIHVPNHLAAASKLWLDIPVTDIFGVGATVESDDAT